MVFPGVNLPQKAADTGAIHPYHNKQILDDEPGNRKLVDNFDVGQPLLVGADFILAFHDVNPFGPQDAVCLAGPAEIQIQHCLVVLLQTVLRAIIVVIRLEVLVILVRGPARRVHVRRVENNTIKHTVAV